MFLVGYTKHMTIVFDDAIQNYTIDELKKEEEEELVKALSDKYGLPYVDLRAIAPEPDALRIIKEEDARIGNLAPFKLIGKNLFVGVVSTHNPKAEEILRGLETRGTEITLFLCSHASLLHVWSRYIDISLGNKVSGGMLDLSGKKLSTIVEKVKTIQDLHSEFLKTDDSKTPYRVSRDLELMIAGALHFNSSDIHLEPEEDKTKLRYRIDGVLQDIYFFNNDVSKLMNSRLKLLSNLKLSTQVNEQDGRFSINLEDREIEVRVSLIPGNYGESFVMRLLDPKNTEADLYSRGMNKAVSSLVERALARPNGLILTTGPTGSGKSTTLYAFLKHIYSSEIKIITIEDPVEYHLDGITQTQVEEEKGYTFLSGLRAALRQDPDVIMVGEIRDTDTAKVAINSALTGHIVFSTLHTNNAAGTIPRLLDLGVNSKVIGSALSLSLAQRLVRKLCVNCRIKYQTEEKESKIITNILGNMLTSGKKDSMENLTAQTSYSLYKANKDGCEKCNSGYTSRIGIFEAIYMTQDLERILSENPSEREIKDLIVKQGVPTLREDAIIKVLQGLTTLEEAGKVVDLYEE